jgi:hypothetical protein
VIKVNARVNKGDDYFIATSSDVPSGGGSNLVEVPLITQIIWNDIRSAKTVMGLDGDSICNQLWLFGERKAGEKEKKDSQDKI